MDEVKAWQMLIRGGRVKDLDAEKIKESWKSRKGKLYLPPEKEILDLDSKKFFVPLDIVQWQELGLLGVRTRNRGKPNQHYYLASMRKVREVLEYLGQITDREVLFTKRCFLCEQNFSCSSCKEIECEKRGLPGECTCFKCKEDPEFEEKARKKWEEVLESYSDLKLESRIKRMKERKGNGI